jgi:hypothetical protein
MGGVRIALLDLGQNAHYVGHGGWPANGRLTGDE